MTKNNNFIIDIVPLTRIPLTRNQSFSYLHAEKLSAGTLVSIPLFRRKVEGIVLGSRDDFKRHGGIELKKVEKVIEENFLTEAQIKLAQFISEYYISPLGIVLKSFVPKRAKARINKKNILANLEPSPVSHKFSEKFELTSSPKGRGGNVILTKEQQLAVGEISKSYKLKAKSFLLFGPAASGKTEVYIHSMLKIKEKNENAQFLVLVPEKTLTPQALERYGQYFRPEEIVVMSSNITRGQFYENWRRVKSGEVKIIIATRIGVFAPFNNLRLVVIDEEQDMSYKNWDMNPRYDARTVAEKLSELYKCPIVRGSATPSIESYYRTSNKELKLMTIPLLLLERGSRSASKIELVDMKKERWAKNYSPISKKLKSEIGYALKNKLQTILLINRQGMSSFSVCESCKNVLKCPKCDRALVYSNKGYYSCIHCAYKTSITPKCSKCGGLVFKNVGLGTQKIEREINNLFPGANVARIDSQAIRVKNYQENVYKKFSSGEIDILVGTQMISKGWDLPNVALVGIIDTDNMLSIPDFSAGAKAYELINQVAGRVNRPGAKWPGVVLIQTFNPENKLLKLIADGNYSGFYEKEILERKGLKLPPFGRIIKLTIQDYSKSKAEKLAESVYKLLKNVSSNIVVSEPQEAYISNIRGRSRRQIILKTTEKKWPAKIIKILKSLPSGWIVDADPISII
ncbi:MAG: primosomal protein N' [Parcubacteria group bacterium]|jgi:primosomal protein N' (replication factor Y)